MINEIIMNENTFFELLRGEVCQRCTASIFWKSPHVEGTDICMEGTCRANFNNLVACIKADYKELGILTEIINNINGK